MTAQDRYVTTQQNISDLAIKYGRKPQEITLIAISKGCPMPLLHAVYQAGARHFGESRAQEATEKIDLCPPDIHWHLVGTLQRKKVAKAVGRFSLIHSVDTPELAYKIANAAKERNIQQAILLQVNTSGEASKHGLSPDGWRHEIKGLQNEPSLSLQGLMTMAPLTENEGTIHHCFADLRKFRDELGLKHLSMGMSHDYPIAIAEGATLLRIGTALFKETA